MSKEYIEKERALQLLEENASDDEVFFAARAIEAEPPADVKSVARGEWIEEPVSKWPRCSECGYNALFCDIYETPIRNNFCPNCGADMREEEKDEQVHCSD